MTAYADGNRREDQKVPTAPTLTDQPAAHVDKRLPPARANLSPQPKLSNGLASRDSERFLGRSPSPTKDSRPPPPPVNIIDLLSTSYFHKQQPQDSGSVAPTNPVPMQRRAVQFPTLQMQVQPSTYGNFEEDTLFFIFYYQQGTPEQLLAAKELKRRDWIYHVEFSLWFQHYGPPKLVTAEKEEGSFIYFDFENGWCKKVKKEFTLLRQHIENEKKP